MSNYIVFKNGEIIKNNMNKNDLWDGDFSKALPFGSIVQFVVNYLKQIDKNTLFLLTVSDGDITLDEINNNTKDYLSPEDTLIVSTLGQVKEDNDIHYLYFPLDDDFFNNGVSYYFQNIPKWNERKAIAYWRGGCSGFNGKESVRCRVVGELLDYDKADVKLTRGWWEQGKGIPDSYLSDRVHYSEMLKYKIFMIIDGNCIASNHMWGFASGGVPFIISNAKCWFIDFLTPFVNYIPIQYDLSDLKEKIDWVINNDSEAEQIAKNALQFSRDYFSSDFQKKYLIEKINQMVGI
jgi:hypothetical protein